LTATIHPVKKVICGRNEPLVREAASQFGWEEFETDWRRVVNRPDIDIVDIATPPVNHCEIALAAIANGKHVFCEKPLAMNATESKRMLDAAQRAGIVHMLGHNYRRVRPSRTLTT
jgi:predicted dehydrogenase